MQKAKAPLLLPEPPANLSNDDAVTTPLSEIGKTQAINLTNQNNTNLRLEKPLLPEVLHRAVARILDAEKSAG